MSHRIKISQNNIIELARPNGANYNLDLLGTQTLSDYDSTIKAAIDNKDLDLATSCFSQNYQEHDCFFYIVRQYNAKTKQPLVTEVGIGTLINDLTELKRIRPLYYIDSVHNKSIPLLNGPFDFLANSDDHYLIIGNYIPNNLAELLIQPNSVIVSSKKEFVPIAVELPQSSVLGRIDDEIQSISLESISNTTLDYFTKYTKQIVLKSSQLDVRKVKTSQLVLQPNDKPDAKRGTLYYSEQDDLLKYFDGTKWRNLVWQDD